MFCGYNAMRRAYPVELADLGLNLSFAGVAMICEAPFKSQQVVDPLMSESLGERCRHV